MAYTTLTHSSTDFTWDSNPSGGASTAKVADGLLTDLVITDGDGNTLVNQKVSMIMLLHIRTVINDLDAFLNPAP